MLTLLPTLRQAYCSDECAFQDAGPDSSVYSESSLTRLSPFLRETPVKDSRQHDGHMTAAAHTLISNGRILPFALHNPRPEFELPIAQYASAYDRKRQDTQRKRISLSSSEASSELSTPSAPSLTDDDDSLSDPEFVLDPHLEAAPSRPVQQTLQYARRSSTTNTRSTVKPHASSTSASASLTTSKSGSSRAHTPSAHSQENRNRTPSRTRRSRDAFALLNDMNKLLYSDERDRRRHTDVRPHSFRLFRRRHYDEEEQNDGSPSRTEELDASYATLTKFSVAAKAAEAIRSPKSRRPPTRSRPRASLPAYFSLTKISKPSPGGFTCDNTTFTSQHAQKRVSGALHKTSPTVAYSDMSSSTATLSGSIHTTAATVAQIARTGSSSSLSNQNKPRHSIFSASGSRPDSPSSEVSVDKKGLPEMSRQTTVREAPAPLVNDDDELASRMASAMRQASALNDLTNVNVGCSDTPRGRTRSRSNRPRSRSRSRTRERAQRAHFGGSPVLRDMVAASGLLMTSRGRGRPHTKGADAAVSPTLTRGRREQKESNVVDVPLAQDLSAEIEIDWLDVRDEPEPAFPERSRRRGVLLA